MACLFLYLKLDKSQKIKYNYHMEKNLFNNFNVHPACVDINQFWFHSSYSIKYLSEHYTDTDILLLKNTFIDESILYYIFNYYFDSNNIIHNKELKEAKKYLDSYKNFKRPPRPDFILKNKKIIIEYDGPTHYTQTNIILKDEIKDMIYKTLNYEIIRIPYFIQLNQEILYKYFNISDPVVYTSYPHGFIHPNVILPEDFCFKGLIKFFKNIKFFNVEKEIKQNLNKNSKVNIKYNELYSMIKNYFKII